MNKYQTKTFYCRFTPIQKDGICKGKGVIFRQIVESIVEDDIRYVSTPTYIAYRPATQCSICKYKGECRVIMKKETLGDANTMIPVLFKA